MVGAAGEAVRVGEVGVLPALKEIHNYHDKYKVSFKKQKTSYWLQDITIIKNYICTCMYVPAYIHVYTYIILVNIYFDQIW